MFWIFFCSVWVLLVWLILFFCVLFFVLSLSAFFCSFSLFPFSSFLCFFLFVDCCFSLFDLLLGVFLDFDVSSLPEVESLLSSSDDSSFSDDLLVSDSDESVVDSDGSGFDLEEDDSDSSSLFDDWSDDELLFVSSSLSDDGVELIGMIVCFCSSGKSG